MKPLHLNVKNGFGIHFNTVMFLDILRQTQFILIFNLHKLLLSLLILCQGLNLADLRKVGDPSVPRLGSNPVGQQGISVKQETSLSNAVGLIVKAIREHLIEVFQFFLL